VEDTRETCKELNNRVNVFVPKVEKIIESYPRVWGNAVIGAPHKLWGEAMVAIVVPKPGEEVTGEKMMDRIYQKQAA